MIRQLAPWFENLGKRQVKAPKVYLCDPGLLHLLLGLPNEAPRVSRLTRHIADIWRLDHLYVVCPVSEGYPVDVDITVLSVAEIVGLQQRINTLT